MAALVSCVVDSGGSCSLDDVTTLQNSQSSQSQSSANRKYNAGRKFLDILTTHMMNSCKESKFSLVAVGGNTCNRLEREHVSEILAMNVVTSTSLSHIHQELKPGSSSLGSIADGIEVALDMLNAESDRDRGSFSSGLSSSNSTSNVFTNVNIGSGSTKSNSMAPDRRASIKYNKVMIIMTDGETAIPIEKMRHIEQHIIPKLVESHCSVYIAFIGTTVTDLNNKENKTSDVKIENALLYQSLALVTNGNYYESDKGTDILSPLMRGVIGVMKEEMRFPWFCKCS